MAKTSQPRVLAPRSRVGSPKWPDEILANTLKQKLRMDRRINWQLLEITVRQGHVKLFGAVKTPEERGLTERVVASEPGVTSVENRIIVQASAPETGKKSGLLEKDGTALLKGEGQIKDQELLP